MAKTLGAFIAKTLGPILYALLSLALALGISWQLLAKLDYLYPVFHDHAGIADTIAEYGPQNRFKSGFADTDREQRFQIFAAITRAVHDGGRGLEEIYYRPAAGPTTALLHRAEIVHLRDVAALISATELLLAALAIIWLIWTLTMLQRRSPLPSTTGQLAKLILLLGAIAVLIAVFGFETVFYRLHIWLFPSDHQWFFYYQDSLMSTMMQAPMLFAYIGLAIAALGALVFALLTTALHVFSIKRAAC